MSDIQDRLQALFPVHCKIGNALLINADCMEVMKHIRDGEFELSCVDPPYGIGVSKDNFISKKPQVSRICAATNYGHKEWDSSVPDADYFIELSRVSKNQIIWGGNHLCNLIGKSSSCWIVWDKVNGGTGFADSELAYTSFTSAVRNFRFQWSGMLQGDMKNKEQRIHPTQKPVKLYEWLLTNYAKPGQHILDTHLGSMSSVIAALNLGFEITGTELDEDYYKAGVERVRQSQQQVRMFDMEAAIPPKQATML